MEANSPATGRLPGVLGRLRSRRVRLVLWAVLALVGTAFWLAKPWAPQPRQRLLDERPDLVHGLTLTDLQGQPASLAQFSDRPVLVLVAMGIDCPVGNLYVPRLKQIAEQYGRDGVQIVGLNPNAHETHEQVAAHSAEYGLTFPVLKDDQNKLADRLRMERTCEAVVLDADRRVRYHGAIDDQYERGKIKPEPGRAYLTEALDAVLGGRKVALRETSVIACPIDRIAPKRSAGPAGRVDPALTRIRREQAQPIEVGAVNYAEHVAPILRAKCQACHSPGEAAPFSLRSLEDAQRWGQSIAEVVDEGLMPPWHADPRYGHFANDRSLSDRDRATLIAWADQGMPPGDPSRAPAPREQAQGWTIGEPDLVFEMLEPFDIPAEGIIDIQKFRVPTHLTEDVWVQAAQAMPGDRAVVHHICVFIIDPAAQSARGLDREQRRELMPELVCYAPGDMPSVFPPGVAKRLPAGATLEIQVHYTPIGTPRFDRSLIGIKLARGPIERMAVTRGVSNRNLVLAPGARDVVLEAEYTLNDDVELLSLTPHMHYRGRSFEYTAVYPDGRSEILLSVPSYDFNWQSVYRLAQPKPLPKGTKLACVAKFDNSDQNPANPDPKATVRWGEQSTDEMMIGYFDYSVPVKGRSQLAGGKSSAR